MILANLDFSGIGVVHWKSKVIFRHLYYWLNEER